MLLSAAIPLLALLAAANAATIDTSAQHINLDDAPPPPPVRRKGRIFKTEPDLKEENFDFMYMTQDRSRIAPGYIFLTPQQNKDGWGPQIYDMDGHLVFHGGAHQKVQDFKACDFQGEMGNHLCTHDRSNHNTKAILNNQYTVERAFGSKYTMRHMKPNGHEFNMLPGGRSYLQAVLENKWIDFPDNPSQTKPNGTFIIDGCFQEIDSDTGESIFAWCGSPDNVDVWDTDLYLNVKGHDNNTSWKAGKGTKEKPWDYFHVNSADKFDGDYLVSSRHFDQIIKIAGPDNRHGVPTGTILWKLGGKTGEFKMDFHFSKQHSIRYLNVTSTETTVAILDNAWEGTNEPTSDCSSGKIIRINNETMTAELLAQYDHPLGMLAEGQGNTQVLPNKNMFIGWGRLPDFSEYAEDGTLLYYVRFETHKHNRSERLDPQKLHHESSYRAVKYPWVGNPQTVPKVLAVPFNGDTQISCPLALYVSWNGATEVKKWRFSTSHLMTGPWTEAVTVDKTGFETEACLENVGMSMTSSVVAFIKTEGLDANDQPIGSRTAMYSLPRAGVKSLFLFVLSVEIISFSYHFFWWKKYRGTLDSNVMSDLKV